ncbi:MAG: YkoF family thiamine/hydroxymethylpyrimidine-binding protein [Candidatus Devosia phytovorans]|uniref:YkoF family thiamine/hydroxymethylpyrimidine-binding protein n=1 Tax=Candidatus Devosia phytovorans TaxID=3121372 RepID=A0AAJ6AZY0_9HYPH|nr:YkoF family thiamine/hydroxymethylpyrimidine-binding protein [Devosia sp.]WEK04612.1 MAG: YkoF family thiamine/hydroxymethylpyrimidine-binding protein [Devosia sp.]
MFSGAQISLYPMTDDFVGVITSALVALDPYRDRLRIETDDISTLLVGPPEELFPVLRDLFSAAALNGKHCVLSATISRGCPGEPDDAICNSPHFDGPVAPLAERQAAALSAVRNAPDMGVFSVAQLSLYVLGEGNHMEEIYGCIDFLKQSGTFEKSKHLATKLNGDTGALFATVEQAFCRFGPPQGHVTIDLTVSANSPSAR